MHPICTSLGAQPLFATPTPYSLNLDITQSLATGACCTSTASLGRSHHPSGIWTGATTLASSRSILCQTIILNWWLLFGVSSSPLLSRSTTMDPFRTSSPLSWIPDYLIRTHPNAIILSLLATPGVYKCPYQLTLVLQACSIRDMGLICWLFGMTVPFVHH